MTFLGIVIAGALGSWIGATAMYWVARWAGRPLVLRFSAALEHWSATRLARLPFLHKFICHLLVTPEKIEKAERWSNQFGSFGIFASRLLPVVRHLIGIPAGIVRLSYVKFSIYTLVGSGLWCTVLAWVGVKAGQDDALMARRIASGFDLDHRRPGGAWDHLLLFRTPVHPPPAPKVVVPLPRGRVPTS